MHKTVAELMDSMTMTELTMWNVFFEDRAIEQKRAENRARGVVDFTDPQSTAQLLQMVGSKVVPPKPGGAP